MHSSAWPCRHCLPSSRLTYSISLVIYNAVLSAAYTWLSSLTTLHSSQISTCSSAEQPVSGVAESGGDVPLVCELLVDSADKYLRPSDTCDGKMREKGDGWAKYSLITHLDLRVLGRDVFDALSASQHRNDLDLALREPPFEEHAQGSDGGSSRGDQGCIWGMDDWHFQKAIYGKRVEGVERTTSAIVNDAETDSRSRTKTRSAVTSVGSFE